MEHILAKVSIMLVPALFAVTLHEVAHGYIADRFGDPTARLLGRLTLNPLKHLDPIGTLALLFFGFGWARPVPVNYNNLRNPKKDMIWVALAGPVTNFSLAVLSALVLKGLGLLVSSGVLQGTALALALEPLFLMMAFSLLINVVLGLFNLIPVPPLDGGRVLNGLLPEKQAETLARLEPFGFVIIVFIIFFTNIWSTVLFPVVYYISGLLTGSQRFLIDRVLNFLLSH